MSWWDTEADEERIASLAAESISVIGGPVNTAAPDNNSAQHATSAMTHDDSARTPDALNLNNTEWTSGSWLLWSGLSLTGLITASLLFRRYRRRATPLSPRSSAVTGSRANKHHQQELKQMHRRVVDACKANQPETAYAAFRTWHSAAIPERTWSTHSLGTYHAALASEFETLESRLYQPGESGAWRGKAFLNAFLQMCTRTDTHTRNQRTVAQVPALYPVHGH